MSYAAQLRPRPPTAPTPKRSEALGMRPKKADLDVYKKTMRETGLEEAEETAAKLATLRTSANTLGAKFGGMLRKDLPTPELQPETQPDKPKTPTTTEDLFPAEEEKEVSVDLLDISEDSMENLANFVAEFEEFRATPYDDYGQLSIGYGSKATGEDQVVTEEQARKLLEQGLERSRQSVLRAMEKYNYDFTENQILALTSFTYNLGSGEGTSDNRPKGLKQLLDVGRRDVEEISDSIELYNKAGGKVLPGLVKRRAAEYKLFNEGFTS